MAGDMLSDALGIRRDVGPEDDIAAVRQRGSEREGGLWKKRGGKSCDVPLGEYFYGFV